MNNRNYIKRAGLWLPDAAICRMNPAFLGSWPKPVSGGGGGGGITLIGSGVSAASANGTSVTTPTYNTTGATLIKIVVAMNDTAHAPTDSKGNTWNIEVSGNVTFGSMRTYTYSCSSPVTDSAHTFSVSANSPAIIVMAFSGITGTLDQHNNSFNNNTTTVQTGPITPSTSGQLLIAALAYPSGGTAAINSGFSTPINVANTVNSSGCAAAYLVQSVAAAINPTFTVTGNQNCATTIGSTK